MFVTRERDERGAVLVLMVVVLTVLMAFSALAIDLGHGRETKRQIQNAADAAALAAAQSLPSTSSADSTAQSIVSKNLDGATSDWAACTDSQPLVNIASSACISYDTSYTQVRVRVPTVTVATFFAKVIGFNSLRESAVAVAGIAVAGLGGIEPFALQTGSTGEQCLKAQPSQQMPTAPCNGPTQGNFGLLDVFQYGNSAMHTTRRCGNGAQQVRLQNNLALGVDHEISVFAGTTVTENGCPPGPNTLGPANGSVTNDFDTGILHGTASTFDDGLPARLQRGPSWYPKAKVAGVNVDNKPLWEFIDPSATNIPTTCRRSGFTGLDQVTAHARLTQCFQDYAAGNGSYGVLFGANSSTEKPLDLYDIQLSPRFAYVPTGNALGGGTPLQVSGFVPVFVQTLYAGCNAGHGCGVTFEPGPWNTGSQGAANDNAQALSAWVLAPGMLPTGLEAPWHVGSTADVELIK